MRVERHADRRRSEVAPERQADQTRLRPCNHVDLVGRIPRLGRRQIKAGDVGCVHDGLSVRQITGKKGRMPFVGFRVPDCVKVDNTVELALLQHESRLGIGICKVHLRPVGVIATYVEAAGKQPNGPPRVGAQMDVMPGRFRDAIAAVVLRR